MILRNFTRNLLRTNRSNIRKTNVDYAICLDIECTCDSPVQIHPMEVIELACIKMDLTSPPGAKSIVNRVAKYPMFHSYARPVINPELTLFCQELTGIMQSTVDEADTIDQVLRNWITWMKEEEMIDDNYEKRKNFAFAACGNFDLSLLSPIIKDCLFNDNLELPIYFKEWINVKKTFLNHKREWPKTLYHMMDLLNEVPTGRLHSARDDCKNLAKVVECLHLEGSTFQVTNKVMDQD